MSVFVDTSALLALLDEDDRFHKAAASAFTLFRAERATLVTHNYLAVEAIALVHRRLGGARAADLMRGFLPELEMIWIDEATHATTASAYLAALPGRHSLVDFVSFEIMRRHGLTRAFTFDADFRSAGFQVIPDGAGQPT